jgi:predicted HTH domain antitoxin
VRDWWCASRALWIVLAHLLRDIIRQSETLMPVIIPDETLQKAGLSERDALIEIACYLFDKEKLHLWPAAQLAGMTRDEFLSELKNRNIPAFRPTMEDIMHDIEVARIIGRHK